MAELRDLLASWQFTSPAALGAGCVGLLLCVLLWGRRPRVRLAFDFRQWAGKVDLKSKGTWVITLLVVAVSALALTALAAPQVVAKERVSVYGKPVMAVVDVSGSMDYRGNTRALHSGEVAIQERSNIEKAQAIFEDMLGRDLGVHYGLLLYSTERYIARYFTFKRALLRDTLENDDEVTFISKGTRTAEAMAAARTYLTKNVPDGDKAILLVSDMQGDLEAMVAIVEEVENCQHAGIKIYVIRIGSDQVRIGNTSAKLPDLEGVMVVDMNDQEGIGAISRELMAMEDSPVNSEESPVRKNVTPFLAAAVLGLAMLCLVLSEGRFRRIP